MSKCNCHGSNKHSIKYIYLSPLRPVCAWWGYPGTRPR
jgi:hypothetical protein